MQEVSQIKKKGKRLHSSFGPLWAQPTTLIRFVYFVGLIKYVIDIKN